MINRLLLNNITVRLCKDQPFDSVILTHGGAGSNPQHSDGTHSAACEGMDLLSNGESALVAAVQAVKSLEDDARFNAGIGSQIRADGKRIQMDAACMTCDGQFGAVACIENVDNPIVVAQSVMLDSPHILLAGDGANMFAQTQGFIKDKNSIGIVNVKKSEIVKPISDASCDTVGAVVFDGKTFAAALSSGGLANSAIGRVGDVPLPGCGLFCGPLGAIACTGDGEFIALKMLAREVYRWLEQKIKPMDAVKQAINLFDASVDIGLIVITKSQYAAHSRNGMAWSHLVGEH